jgi:hypothetical protein
MFRFKRVDGDDWIYDVSTRSDKIFPCPVPEREHQTPKAPFRLQDAANLLALQIPFSSRGMNNTNNCCLERFVNEGTDTGGRVINDYVSLP